MADLHTSYNDWHRERQAIGAKHNLSSFGPWHQTVEKLLPPLRTGRLLEIGCGAGDFAIRLAMLMPEVEIVGTDFSEAAIELARRKIPVDCSNLTFQVEDAQRMSLADSSFDYAISCECLEHVPVPRAMTEELARVLKKGGGYILTTENYLNGCLLVWMQHWLTGKPINSGSGVQPHENFFLFWMVRRHLESAGLSVEHMESNYFQWLLLPRVAPDKLRKTDFSNPLLKRVFCPFGRHFTFQGRRP